MATIEQLKNRYIYLRDEWGEELAIKMFCNTWPKEAQQFIDYYKEV